MTNEELFHQMMDTASDEMDFVIERVTEPDKTFSAEAVDELLYAMRLFVGARIAARFRDRGPGAPGVSNLRVSVSLTLDGERIIPSPDMRPWYALDGFNRRAALDN